MTSPARPTTRREDVVDVVHGVEVADPYRWLERADSDEVAAWDEAHRRAFEHHAKGLGEVAWLRERLGKLWRYDDESSPRPCLRSDRVFFHRKRADQDKWVACYRDGDEGDVHEIIDPNTWARHDTLGGFFPSPDGRYVVYGRAHAGDENPVLRVLDLQTMEHLPDTMKGWKQGGVVWRHDNSGFWFSARPDADAVGEEASHYWHRVWFHALGRDAAHDELVLWDDETRERFHGVLLSEDGRWLLLGRYRFNANQLWLAPADRPSERLLLTDEMDAEYDARVVGDHIIVRTDWQASRYRLMVADVREPGRSHWRELVAEADGILVAVAAIGGRLYLTYQEDASSRIAVHTIDGTWLHDVELPGLCTASVWGFWSRPKVWVDVVSFDRPREVHTWSPEQQRLSLYRASPLQLDTSDLQVSQVWFPSKDGTSVSMFLLHRKDARPTPDTPWLLTGYGGFNISRTPAFSSAYALWAKSGGGVAVANLRGGGEYGRAWHRAGMREHKQNVFDDFIAAAEYLHGQGLTSPDRLAIAGGSNGGLLVSAVCAQRPELFAAVLCAVPLTDMIRFPRFGIASIWTEEYGDPAVADEFEVLLAYSPYHNVHPGPRYPATLVTGSLNDARTDPVHARKFYAALDHAAGGEDSTWLLLQEASGHHGAVTIDEQAAQVAMHYGFLMSETGLQRPD